jgi:hypothetical protein
LQRSYANAAAQGNNITPVPNTVRNLSTSPASDPSSSTLVHHSSTLTTPPSIQTLAPDTPDHIIFLANILDVKVQAKVASENLNFSKVFVCSSMREGKLKITYTKNRNTQVLDPNWVTIIHPNVKQTDALLVVLQGEYAGRFALRICHSRSHSEDTALVKIINRIEGGRLMETGLEVHLPAKHLAIAWESNEEKKWHTEFMQVRRKQARS